ncbi:Polysulfide reductase, NrfD [compost metagenome]
MIGVGILLPQLLSLVTGKKKAHRPSHLVLLCSLSLLGILMLRYFILYAGQMTLV